MNTIIRLSDIKALVEHDVLPLLATKRIFTFEGPLGAGKTTIIKEILRAKGVEGVISSPTFTYVNRYAAPGGFLAYHFDLYRIETLDQFYAHGFDEYLYDPTAYCFIEWPAVIAALLDVKPLSEEVISLSISYDETDREIRRISW